jgi:hypothetical protein
MCAPGSGDFARWKEPDVYQEALARLPRDLKVEASPAADSYPGYGKWG